MIQEEKINQDSRDDRLRIIIIDDDVSIHRELINLLKTRNDEVSSSNLPLSFVIDTAQEGKEGVLKIAEGIKRAGPYALAFVGIRKSTDSWNVMEIIKNTLALDANLPIVICSAFPDQTWKEALSELGKVENLLIIKKPFDPMTVRKIVYAFTKKWQAIEETKQYALLLETNAEDKKQGLQKVLMHAALDSAAEAVLVVDIHNTISYYNKKLLDLLTIPESVIAKGDFLSFQSYLLAQLESSKNYKEKMTRLNTNPQGEVMGTFKLHDKNVIEYYTQPYLLNDRTLGRIWSFRNVTERVLLEEELHHQAIQDLL